MTVNKTVFYHIHFKLNGLTDILILLSLQSISKSIYTLDIGYITKAKQFDF